MKKKRARLSLSTWMFLLTLLLSLIGLFFIFEASTVESFSLFAHPYYFLKQQAVWLVIGLVIMLVTRFIPLIFWQKISPLLYGFSIVLLLLVFIPGLGVELNGARRWFVIAGTSFQPVEILKFTIVVYFANWLSKHQRFLPFIFLLFLPSVILLIQPDMGSLLIILSIVFALFYVAGGQIKYFALAGVVGIALLTLLIIFSPYRRKRVQTFFNPDSDPLGASFHIKQITLALGNGGWFGQGIGNSVQKYAYIPEASSDSIFAIVAEEIGFIGSTLVIILFMLYFYLIYKIAHLYKSNTFPFLLALGILAWLAGQTLLNLASLVSLVPLTGLPLPFLSYGGSSLVMVLFANGLLLRVASSKEVKNFR